MTHFCYQCGAPFERHKSGTRPIKYCSFPCYNEARKGNPNSGAFKPGQRSWNTGLKGFNPSPATNFKKGMRPINKVTVGTVRIRKDKQGKPRAFVKVAEPNKWEYRAVKVWEEHHGCEVPPGMVVHHRDRNSLNDHPDNLEAMTRADHINEHRNDL